MFILKQLTIEACDNGVPHKCNTTQLRITIDRTGFAPTFTPTASYFRLINETHLVGSEVVEINTIDASPKVSLGCVTVRSWNLLNCISLFDWFPVET